MEQGNTASDPGDLPSLDFVFEQIEKRFDVQRSVREALDTKIAFLFGFAGVMLTAVLGAHGWLRDMSAVSLFLFAGAVVALVVSLVLSLWAYLPRTYGYPPDPRGLREGYISRSPADTQLALIDARIIQFEDNEPIVTQKSKLLKRALWALLISICLLASSIVLGLLPACVWQWLASIADAVWSMIV